MLRHELELSKSHLVQTEQRLKTGMRANCQICHLNPCSATNAKQRQDIVDALKKFFLHDGHRTLLRDAQGTSSGELDWWRGRSEGKCADVECTEDGVKARDSSGVCQGCIALPKHRLWMLTLRFKCSRRPSDEIVIINLGQSPLSLFSVGRVHCDANGSRTQELSVPFVGGHLAFRFKFVSKSGLGFGQIHLEQGRFVQFDYPELEDKGGGTVCSGLVRELRLQRVQGKQRSVELLEELDRLDRSPADLPHFDSELLQGTPQRFQKAELKSMLHEELTKELRRSEAEAEAVEVKAAVESEKMRLAKERLVLRKRKGCNASDALEKGEALVGRKVEIYDAETHRWKVGTVEAMRSRWVDQDTRLEITHKVSGLQPQTAISTSFEAHQQEEAMWQDLLSQQFVLLDADEEEMEIRRKTRGKTR